MSDKQVWEPLSSKSFTADVIHRQNIFLKHISTAGYRPQPEQHSYSSTTLEVNPRLHLVMCFLPNRTFCCLQHSSFLSFEEQQNRGLSLCCFVNPAMLVQSVVHDPRQWSNRELNIVCHFHVSHSCLWYTVLWAFISILCRCCSVNMWTHIVCMLWWNTLYHRVRWHAFGWGLSCS